MMVIDGFRNWSRRRDEYEADKNKYSRLPNELDEIINRNKNPLHTPVKLDLLKVVNRNNQYFVYFSVTSSVITIIDIISKDFNLIMIEPRKFTQNNSPGFFSFTKINSEGNHVKFEIIYEDQYTVKHSKKYLLSLSENILRELL